MSWRDDAACIGAPVELFFPRPGRNNGAVVKRLYCDSCPVRQECLDFAMEVENATWRAGVWGGMTPTERSRYAKERKEASCEPTA